MTYPMLRNSMLKRINTYLKNPINSFFLAHYKRIHILKDLTKKNAREVSFHCYLTKFLTYQDIISPGEVSKNLFLIMQGVVGVYI